MLPEPVNDPSLTLHIVSYQTREGEHLALLSPQTLTRAVADITNQFLLWCGRKNYAPPEIVDILIFEICEHDKRTLQM